MEMPNLPTDNLYKFMSLTGILFIVFFYVYPMIRIDRINNECNSLLAELEILNASTEILEHKQNSLTKDFQSLEKKLKDKYGDLYSFDKIEKKSKTNIEKLRKELQDKKYREYLKFTFDYERFIIPEINELALLKSMSDSVMEIKNKHKLVLVEIKSKTAQISEKIKQERNWLWREIIGITLGLILTTLGFKSWYYKVQVKLDEKLKLENELLKININKEETKIVETKA